MIIMGFMHKWYYFMIQKYEGWITNNLEMNKKYKQQIEILKKRLKNE